VKRSGFTLVELLVVVAIIALLISILAPSLKSAKDLAKQMICATNLHGLGLGVTMYAEANRGGLLPWTVPKSPGAVTLYDMQYQLRLGYVPLSFICTYRLSDTSGTGQGYIDPSTGKPQPWGISSLLLLQGQLGSANSLYCPSKTTGQMSKAAFPDPYGERFNSSEYALPNSGIVKCSYPINPHADNRTGTPVFKYTRLEHVPAGVLMGGDPFFNSSWGTTAHTTSGETSPTWNRMFIDGHVSAKTSSALYTHVVNADPQNYWDDFDKALSYIQD